MADSPRRAPGAIAHPDAAAAAFVDVFGRAFDRDALALAEQSAGIGVWSIDLPSDHLRATAQFFRIMGLPPTTEAIPVDRVRALRHPDDRDRVLAGFREALDGGRDAYEIEYRIVRPDGQLRWIFGRGRVVRDETGLVVDYITEGDFPKFGNNDNRVDQLAAAVVSMFMSKLRKHPTYRNALHTQSVLTITSNVVYGKHTGTTPDGRKKGEAFAPGANPSNGRDSHGALAALMSVAKIPYDDSEDGISLTLSVVPSALGSDDDRLTRGSSALDHDRAAQLLESRGDSFARAASPADASLALEQARADLLQPELRPAVRDLVVGRGPCLPGPSGPGPSAARVRAGRCRDHRPYGRADIRRHRRDEAAFIDDAVPPCRARARRA